MGGLWLVWTTGNIMKKVSKRFADVKSEIDKDMVYSVADAMELVKKGATAKFDESVEMHVVLGIDVKKGDQQVRSTVVLPHGVGKTTRVAVITSTHTDEATKAGADIVGGEELIEEIKSGKLLDKFDVLVATPEMMMKLAQVARVLGPRGLMPNPKTETVTTNIAGVVESLKKGKVSFRNDKTGIIHQVIGKDSFETTQLVENYETLLEAIESVRPSGHKGKYIKKVILCSTMGPSVIVYKS